MLEKNHFHRLARFELSQDYEGRHVSRRQRPCEPRPTVPISVFVTLDAEVHEQVFRSRGQSEVKTPSV
ncbi:hypothetical protein TNCV_4253511 [Trichonephila clavipes]|nr:hypothetical protein TNCV_4253511 [Trichonephila clavipes]